MSNESIEELRQKLNETKNVAIFVDFDNIYYSLKDFGIVMGEGSYDIFKILNDIYTKEKIRVFKAYADFEQVRVSFKWLQDNRVQIRNVFGNGLEENSRKNASDIELSIDAIEAFYRKPEVDTFVFVTSDSDMIPVMNKLMFDGKKVHLYYIDEHTSQYQSLNNMCNLSIELVDMLEIDRERGTLSYWIDDAKKAIDGWYTEPRNLGKTLGGRWLQTLLCEKLGLTKDKSDKLVRFLEEEGHIFEGRNEMGNKYYKTIKTHIV